MSSAKSIPLQHDGEGGEEDRLAELATTRGRWRATRYCAEYHHQLWLELSPPAKRQEVAPTDLRLPHVAYGRASRCLIMEMPDELLLQIFEQSVPTGMTFHAFPHTTRTGSYPSTRWEGTAVHSFGKPVAGRWLEDPRVSATEATATSLASVCRRFAAVYCMLMYGNNHWTFAMAMESANHTISPPIKDEQINGTGISSWSRVFEIRSLGLWPLTARTCKYVKDLSVLIELREDDRYHEVQCLAGQLQRSVALFGESEHMLKSLTVDIASVPLYRCTKTPIWPVTPPRGRLTWFENGAGTYGLKLDHPGHRPDYFKEDVEAIWEALRPLRGVRDVCLSGIGSEGKAEELAAVIKSEPVTSMEHTAQEEAARIVNEASKRRRLR